MNGSAKPRTDGVQSTGLSAQPRAGAKYEPPRLTRVGSLRELLAGATTQVNQGNINIGGQQSNSSGGG